MTTTLQIYLIIHILIGLLGVVCSYAVLMELFRFKPQLKKLIRFSAASFWFYLISWVTGGYYYLKFYGAQVKPIILAGPYPWAHTFFTEVKEHVFLFLPFLALITWLAFWGLQQLALEEAKLKQAVRWLVALQCLIGLFVTVAGFIISGSVR